LKNLTKEIEGLEKLKVSRRILTALIGIPIFIYILYKGGILFLILVALIALLGLVEFFLMSGKRTPFFLIACVFLILYYWNLCSKLIPYSIFPLMLLYLMITGIFNKKLRKIPEKLLFEISTYAMLFTMLTAFLGSFYELRILTNGLYWCMFLVLTIWATDTCAYFGGKYFGKSLLIQSISPKKTVEGAIIGLISALIIGTGFFFFSTYYQKPLQMNLIKWLLISFIISLFAQIGDLIESVIKRAFKVKDSGNILPGHGGILDRFDSLIICAPVMYSIVKILY